MSESTANSRNKIRRRVAIASVSVLAVFVASWALLACVGQVRESVDRAH